MNSELKHLLNLWTGSGRVGFVYSRKKQIALNGQRPISYADALKYLREFFDTFQSKVQRCTEY